MEACAQGGASAARAAFESWRRQAQPYLSCVCRHFAAVHPPPCAADHATAAHPRHAQRLILRCTPPPSREIEMVAAWRRRLLRPGQHCCKSCAGAVRGGLAGTGCDHTKTGKSRSGPSATRGAPGSLPGAHSGGGKVALEGLAEMRRVRAPALRCERVALREDPLLVVWGWRKPFRKNKSTLKTRCFVVSSN